MSHRLSRISFLVLIYIHTYMHVFNRAALRNVVHIDLYDNFGLAQDLKAKHNGCYCYVTATPRNRSGALTLYLSLNLGYVDSLFYSHFSLFRMTVASTLATEILTRFGIGSASVKLIGNRNKYSQVILCCSIIPSSLLWFIY